MNNGKNKSVVGILAHVDAGKTTLAESILYLTGSIRRLGRVDHKDAFLDTYELERARGITIFSKQAVFTLKDREITLLDTPGHVDFSAEMERTLQVLDYAILVISGTDGVQGHTDTLWRLLKRYKIPTFIFINKMDIDGTNKEQLIQELKEKLEDNCVDFSEGQEPSELLENLAMCDETLLEQYMNTGSLESEAIAAAISKRKVFPCYFGSALRLLGVEEFLNGLYKYTSCKSYGESFGARVYKVVRDEQDNRLTYMKITGGSLKVKMALSNRDRHSDDPEEASADIWEEKVNQIRIYSGAKYETVDEVAAGTICAVTGLSKTYPGEGLGEEDEADLPILEPVLNYQVLLPPECDPTVMYTKLRQLEEEDPLLHIIWSQHLKEIHIQLMGEVQIDILKSRILERFGVKVEFGSGNILYKETIKKAVVGMGHYEPLRHYAEVHLLMEPAEPGSGIIFDSSCSEDELDRNWQRLILTHLEEKEHVGVLTGSPITDMKITLIAGRAHLKHTEGGDFRQATYRAVRQGLMKANSVLLEPYYSFVMELPSEAVGRAMTDLSRMSAEFKPPELNKEMAILVGSAPVATMRGYQAELTAYTRGRGKLFCTLKGYEPCHNAEEVIAAIGYDSERDLNHPASSVFCSHGAGFVVEWNKVHEYIHINSEDKLKGLLSREEQKEAEDGEVRQVGRLRRVDWEATQEKGKAGTGPATVRAKASYEGSIQEDKELEAIFTRTFGPIRQKTLPGYSSLGYEKNTASKGKAQANKVYDTNHSADRKNNDISGYNNLKEKEPVKEYLLVDGYNIIYAWDELRQLADDNVDAARDKLMDTLSNYQGFKKCNLILVFDAYKVKGGVGEQQDYSGIHVVYTKEAETADMYIEKVTHEIGRKHRVTVATSDRLEQLIILGQGAVRLSAKELQEEVERVNEQIRSDFLDKQPKGRNYLGDHMSDDIKEIE